MPHFRLPLRLLPSGDFETLEQNTTPEVAQHVAVLLRTPLGSRLLERTLGLQDPTHRLAQGDGATLELVEQQLADHEPRAEYHAALENASPGEWVERVLVDVTGASNG